MMTTTTNQKQIWHTLLITLAAIFALWLLASPVSAAHVKVMPVTQDGGAHALQHANAHKYIIKTADIKKADLRDLPSGGKAVDVSVDATPRASGGITVELFCRDNVGHYMPVWGGSITKGSSDWAFSYADIGRTNIDGCYFGVIDSTAEMEAII